ncbi:hypothetical protein PF005_g21748 [Phytophthora fragariae]|uniref:Uncharacterized protein n=1 Tax=Phytophthora fragariae TaxID=53985 RepID=A0A6A3IU86_9STRA|nr:hypothetical protein PF011_g20442 [Phytophthora fragariae]KAE9083676.1 hypothetical protein PF007_g21810 [Phytophthora fragariae]KAE9084126.1 hypothetical protein PF010_g20960 [Phytophthora fragariae]KAE9096615.1 hypothetical protein PF006_g23739 [Phytophthora fragariae]KAE9184249.1 hypothetical protein PF005_g21748 [Phytophthora fragariae]
MLIEGLPPLINATSSLTHMRDSSMRYTNDLDSDSEESDDEDESSIKSMDGFMKDALEHVKNIPGYEGHNIKIFTKFGRGIRINRKKSSHCGMCEHDHDNDNTVLLFFNAKQGCATWRCDRAQGEK